MNIAGIVENSKKIYMSESSLSTLMDFERVLDELDMYAFKNWKKGELIEGPVRNRHWVECTFMWPHALMPDPDGGKRLLEYRATVKYEKDTLTSPVKVEGYDDFRPGTKKPKLEEKAVWTVKISLPVEIIEDIQAGFIELEGTEIDLQDLDAAYNDNMSDTTAMDAQQGVTPGDPDAAPTV